MGWTRIPKIHRKSWSDFKGKLMGPELEIKDKDKNNRVDLAKKFQLTNRINLLLVADAGHATLELAVSVGPSSPSHF